MAQDSDSWPGFSRSDFWLFSMILAGGGLYTVTVAGSGRGPIKMNRLTGKVWIYCTSVTRGGELWRGWFPAEGPFEKKIARTPLPIEPGFELQPQTPWICV